MDPSAATGSTALELVPWEYERPPRPLDLVENNAFSNGARVVLHVLLRLYLRLCHHYRAEGGAGVGGEGPMLVVANHTSHLDVAALFAALPLSGVNRVRTLVAKDYFFASWVKRAVGFLVANAVPLDRERLEASVISYCRRVVSAGGSLVVFPEGTRAEDGQLHPFRPGVGMLAKALKVRVVPACIRGTFACLPKGARWPCWRPVEVVFGQPMGLEALADSREGWNTIAERLEEQVRELSSRAA